MSQEFPKALYLGEAFVIVEDAEQEAAKRAEGFRFYTDEPSTETGAEQVPGESPEDSPEDSPKRKPGRPRKEA